MGIAGSPSAFGGGFALCKGKIFWICGKFFCIAASEKSEKS
jgi:hypothetical protein